MLFCGAVFLMTDTVGCATLLLFLQVQSQTAMIYFYMEESDALLNRVYCLKEEQISYSKIELFEEQNAKCLKIKFISTDT